MNKIIEAKTMHKSIKMHYYMLFRLERLVKESYSNEFEQDLDESFKTKQPVRV